MATLCLRRLCRTNLKTVRQIYSCEVLSIATPLFFKHDLSQTKRLKPGILLQPCPVISRYYSDKFSVKVKPDKPKEKKPSLLQRFKQMYKDYWYVLVPVHLVTSAAWFGGFYYLAKSGVDIAGILESWNVTQKITNTLRDSSMGYIAVAYALYKLATPLRYTVTLGGTTISINYLKAWGYIKPVPSKDQLKEMYKERKENIMETYKERKENIMETYKERKENIMESYKERKENIMETFKEGKGFYKEKKDSIMDSVSGSQIQFKLQKEQEKDKKDFIVKDIGKGLEKIKKVKEDVAPKPEELIKITKKEESS